MLSHGRRAPGSGLNSGSETEEEEERKSKHGRKKKEQGALVAWSVGYGGLPFPLSRVGQAGLRVFDGASLGGEKSTEFGGFARHRWGKATERESDEDR
jgi:hypothetical protein